jgi:threonine/homoserine/homoserine lactone efflux protein
LNNASLLAGIAIALAAGAMSPGPSFLIVARASLSQSRAHGFAAAMGMGAGGLLFAAVALFGLHTALAAAPWLTTALKYVGGFYLLYLGISVLLTAPMRLTTVIDSRPSTQSVFRTALVAFTTQISNPKTVLTYVGIFSAFVPSTRHALFVVCVLLTVLIVELSWYLLVAVAFSTERARSAYFNAKTLIDRAVGLAMFALGATLLASGVYHR